MTGPYNNKNQPMITPKGSRQLVVILPLNTIAMDKIQMIRWLFIRKRMEEPSLNEIDQIIDNLFLHLSRTFLISVKDLRITDSLFDCVDTPEYAASMQTCVDSLMFDLSRHGLDIGLTEAFEIVQNCELSMIEEICAYIPDFDEAYMVITTTHYRSRFNFYIHIETNPQFKGF